MNPTVSRAVPPGPADAASSRAIRVACFVSHPIQYQAPLFRRIAEEPDLDLTVFFSSDLSVRGYKDEGFGVRVEWDVPLLEGYKHEFLPRIGEGDRVGFAKPLNWGIFNRLHKGRFDAVWVFGYGRLASLQAIFAAWLLRLPVLIRGDSSILQIRPKKNRIAKSLFLKLLRPLLSGALAVGQSNAAYWRKYLGADFPIYSVPFAVDNEYFQRGIREASRDRESLRRELGLEPGRPVVLFASKLQAGKRCIDLIEAYIRLARENCAEPNAYLLIAGDGEERASLAARVRQSKLASIRFLGFQNQSALPRLFDLCDVFVMPSIFDAWGLIVNEVMNAGRPLIVNDLLGCQQDLVHNGVNGFVYPAYDVDALSHCLRRLIENPMLRATMGENSLRIIRQYSFEQDVAGLRKALHAVVMQ